jgi:hypothetical protein
MALALASAALTGAVLGIVWHKLAGDEKQVDMTTTNPAD